LTCGSRPPREKPTAEQDGKTLKSNDGQERLIAASADGLESTDVEAKDSDGDWPQPNQEPW